MNATHRNGFLVYNYGKLPETAASAASSEGNAQQRVKFDKVSGSDHSRYAANKANVLSQITVPRRIEP